VADTLLEKSIILWEAILEGDYGVSIKDYTIQHTANTRRASKRRRRQSILGRVKEAHLMVIANTDIAYYYLEELVNSTTTTKTCLTKSRLSQLLQEYGPHLRINDRTKTGGTFLVACCRARHCREVDILKCIQLLVETYHANLNLATFETIQSNNQTPLMVAAARGMSTIVKYLLQQQQQLQGTAAAAAASSCACSTTVRGTGRFRLHANKKKSIKFVQATPLEVAEQMRAAEWNEGASKRDLKHLDTCIRLLYFSSRY
jgi:hypothetical protein